MNIQETPQKLAFFLPWSAGFWKRRKAVEASMRAYDWRLATPAMPFKPPHVPSLVWSDPFWSRSKLEQRSHCPSSLLLYMEMIFSTQPTPSSPLQSHTNLPLIKTYLHLYYFYVSSHGMCGKLLYCCLSDVLYDHPVELFDCIFSILLNTLSLHWLNELLGLMHFQEQLSLWLPACVLVKWEKPKTLQLKWLLKFMKINAKGIVFFLFFLHRINALIWAITTFAQMILWINSQIKCTHYYLFCLLFSLFSCNFTLVYLMLLHKRPIV